MKGPTRFSRASQALVVLTTIVAAQGAAAQNTTPRTDPCVVSVSDTAGASMAVKDSITRRKSAANCRTTRTSGGDVNLTSSRRARSDVRIPVSKEPAPEPVAAAPEPTPAPAPTPAPVEPPPAPTPAPVVVTESTVTYTPEPLPLPPVKKLPRNFYVGLGGGTGVPADGFKNAYDPGYTVQGMLGWDSWESLYGFRVNVGYTHLDRRNAFRNTGTLSPGTTGANSSAVLAAADPQIWSALADLKLRLPIVGGTAGPWSGLYVVGGGGMNYFRNYGATIQRTNPELNTTVDPDDGSHWMGAANVGGGISFGFHRQEVFLESRYVASFNGSRRGGYVPIVLGMTFR